MESLVASAERRFGVDRTAMAPKTVFVSHETYTPARGGSAAAEIAALRKVFGPAADRVIVANTKGFTGHPMGVGIEDVIGVKILEHQVVPPVPNLKEPDPDLGNLTLSKGGRYDVEYAIHLAAGFGSQIAMTLTRRIPGPLDRVDDRARHAQWLAEVSGHDGADDRGGEARAAREVPGRPGPGARAEPVAVRAGAGDGGRVTRGRGSARGISPLALRSFPRKGTPVVEGSPGRLSQTAPTDLPRTTPHPSSPVRDRSSSGWRRGARSCPSSPRRPATRRTCSTWTSTSRRTSGSTR